MKTLIMLCPLLAILLMANACQQDASAAANKEKAMEKEMSQEAMEKHGEYLVTMIGCDDCHTPKKMTEKGPVPDMDNRFMGHPANMALPEITAEMYTGKWVYLTPTLTAAVGPWGTSYAANITSDETGIGNWTYENFKAALTKGIHKGMEGQRPIMPPMPWQAFKHMKEKDMKAIYAFLQSTKPIPNVVPPYNPPPAPEQ